MEKVVILSRHFRTRYGGGERCDEKLLSSIRELGREVTLIFEDECDQIEIIDGVECISIRKAKSEISLPKFRVFYYFFYLRFAIISYLRLRSNNVEYQFVFLSGPPTIVVPFLTKKVFVSFHGKMHRSWRPLIGFCNAILDYGAHNLDLVKKVVLPFAPPMQYRPYEINNFVKRRSACFVGRIVPVKNLIETASKLKELNVDLDIFGTGDTKIIEELKTFDNVNLHGFLKFHEYDPEEYKHAFIVNLSHSESYNLVIREFSCSYGLPCLVTESADPFNFVQHGTNGLSYSDVSNITHADIMRLLDLDSVHVREFSLRRVEKEIETNMSSLSRLKQLMS